MAKFTEIQAMGKVDEALEGLEDESARGRIIRWASEKYGVAVSTKPMAPSQLFSPSSQPSLGTLPVTSGGEIPGIAKFVGDELRVLARDIKASSTNDAAIRLVHIAIRANEALTGSATVSSRHIVTPILKAWRAYTGNTRPAIANQKGILRNGDLMSLDEHGKRDADEYMRQILDSSVEGTWNPNAVSKRTTRKVAGKRSSK